MLSNFFYRKQRALYFCLLSTLESMLAFGQISNPSELHTQIEREHGIKLLTITGGVFPHVDEEKTRLETSFDVPPRRLRKMLHEEFKLRNDGNAIKSFYLGATEISRGQMESVYRGLYPFQQAEISSNPFMPWQNNNASAPAGNFNFGEAAMFCNALSRLYELPEYYRFSLVIKPESPEDDTTHVGIGNWSALLYSIEVPERDGKGFRLPTILEWEYACRAGASTAYSFGDNPKDICEHGCNSECKDEKGRKPQRPVSCGSYKANPWGFYDLHGNVWEWCMGRFKGNRLCDQQYLKGGSVNSTIFELRCSYVRLESTDACGFEDFGFGLRIARNQ